MTLVGPTARCQQRQNLAFTQRSARSLHPSREKERNIFSCPHRFFFFLSSPFFFFSLLTVFFFLSSPVFSLSSPLFSSPHRFFSSPHRFLLLTPIAGSQNSVTTKEKCPQSSFSVPSSSPFSHVLHLDCPSDGRPSVRPRNFRSFFFLSLEIFSWSHGRGSRPRPPKVRVWACLGSFVAGEGKTQCEILGSSAAFGESSERGDVTDGKVTQCAVGLWSHSSEKEQRQIAQRNGLAIATSTVCDALRQLSSMLSELLEM